MSKRKLSDADRECIKTMYDSGEANQVQLAAHYNVSQATIWSALNHERSLKLGREKANARYEVEGELLRARVKIYKVNNPERVAASQRAWCDANPEQKALSDQRNHARRKGAEGHGFNSPCDWYDAFTLGWGDACCYCECAFTIENPWTLEHIVPISRGGSHHPENLAPACRRCNYEKHNTLLANWRGGIYAKSVPAHAAAIAAILRGE